jgi:hypothetical protein
MSWIRRLMVLVGCLALSQPAFAQTTPPAPPASNTNPQPGRYQLVVVPGHAGNPFMLDTATGCAWHVVQDEKTKRSTFIEMDVENLHWSWGSGAQSMLAARVDGSNLTAEQKQTLKQDLQKTGCGVSHVVLTPNAAQVKGAAETPAEPAKAPAADKPKKK